jgi:YidC/Oxa1 family membrane protein insertase
LDSETRSNRKWLWIVGTIAMFSLSGCGLYPSKPGEWPHGIWGDVLKGVSSTITFFANHLGGNYGIALLVVTVLVRLLVMPLMIKQIRYQKVLQQLQPDIQKIRQKHKGDNQKIQEETMKLWQKHGANPMSGCFPMLVQLPVLYALFGAIEGNTALNNYTFLGIFHLGSPDHYYILPLLAAVTTYLSSKVMMTGNDSQQKMMLFIMPVFIFLIGSRFASGLALYWIYTNIFQTVQSYFVRVKPAQADSAPSK